MANEREGLGCRNKTGEADPDLCSKYCIDHRWSAPCDGCGEPVEMTYARAEVLGCYHDGCFGWPACSCKSSHRGVCPKERAA